MSDAIRFAQIVNTCASTQLRSFEGGDDKRTFEFILNMLSIAERHNEPDEDTYLSTEEWAQRIWTGTHIEVAKQMVMRLRDATSNP